MHSHLQPLCQFAFLKIISKTPHSKKINHLHLLLCRFEDTERSAISVGMGLTSGSKKCYTNGNGPEVFKQCAKAWVSLPDNETDYDGQYEQLVGQGGCEFGMEPPSADNQICKKFHSKIAQLKTTKALDEIDEEFVRQFLQVPAESLLIPTADIRCVTKSVGLFLNILSVTRKITETVKNNKTYCFSTQVGEYGWCATCKVSQYMSS